MMSKLSLYSINKYFHLTNSETCKNSQNNHTKLFSLSCYDVLFLCVLEINKLNAKGVIRDKKHFIMITFYGDSITFRVVLSLFIFKSQGCIAQSDRATDF